jgi:hypothetical protein
VPFRVTWSQVAGFRPIVAGREAVRPQDSEDDHAKHECRETTINIRGTDIHHLNHNRAKSQAKAATAVAHAERR